MRPPRLTNGKQTRRYEVLTGRDEWRNGTASRADVAHFICECIANNAHVHETPEIAAPRR